MRVVQLGKYFPPYFGGLERVVELSASALASHHEVVVICHNHLPGRSDEQRQNFRVIRCRSELTLFRQPISLTMGMALRRSRPDLVHFHAPNFWAAAMLELFCANIPVVVTHHADVEGRWLLRTVLKPLYRRILARANIVFVSSLRNATLSEDLVRANERLSAIPFGLNENRYQMSSEQMAKIGNEKRSRFGHETVFGFVGRLVWYKGLSVLLEAFARLDGGKLVIVGDGPLSSELKDQAARLKIGERVNFVGVVTDSEKIRLIQMFDVLVLPSTHQTETFGLVQIEAQLSKKPVITTDLPTAVSEVTVNEVTGIIVKRECVSELSAAMARLAADGALRERFGANGFKRAMENYTERHYMEKLRSEMEEALAAGARLDKSAKMSRSEPYMS